MVNKVVLVGRLGKDPEVRHLSDTSSVCNFTLATFLESYSLGKTIVLTGAMIPYSFGASDALFNLGSALAFAQVLSSGVYVAMNGKYYKAGTVKKNRSTGYFEAK